jgi:hypothetical protein
MTQDQLDRSVARITGDSLATVKRLGFVILSPRSRNLARGELHLVLDCPYCGRPVRYPGPARDGTLLLAECARCDVEFDFELGEVYASRLELAEAS